VLFATTCDVGASVERPNPGADAQRTQPVAGRSNTVSNSVRLIACSSRISRAVGCPRCSSSTSRGVLWSPDGDALAITDYGDSNGSSVVVFRCDSPQNPSMSSSPCLLRSVAFRRCTKTHRYFRGFRWLATDKLEFRVHAHDAGPGEEYRGVFEFDLRTGKVRRQGRARRLTRACSGRRCAPPLNR